MRVENQRGAKPAALLGALSIALGLLWSSAVRAETLARAAALIAAALLRRVLAVVDRWRSAQMFANCRRALTLRFS